MFVLVQGIGHVTPPRSEVNGDLAENGEERAQGGEGEIVAEATDVHLGVGETADAGAGQDAEDQSTSTANLWKKDVPIIL